LEAAKGRRALWRDKGRVPFERNTSRVGSYTKMHGLKPMHLVLRSSATRAVRAMGRGGQKAASKMR
jgi:hypothetical protein